MNNKNNILSETDLQVLAEQFCDQWCKYPDQIVDDLEHWRSLLEHCEYCPISKLLESNYNNICSYYEEK